MDGTKWTSLPTHETQDVLARAVLDIGTSKSIPRSKSLWIKATRYCLNEGEKGTGTSSTDVNVNTKVNVKANVNTNVCVYHC